MGGFGGPFVLTETTETAKPLCITLCNTRLISARKTWVMYTLFLVSSNV